MILSPTGLFAATNWRESKEQSGGAWIFRDCVPVLVGIAESRDTRPSSGLGVTYGFNDNANPAPTARQFDIATAPGHHRKPFIPIVPRQSR